MSKIAEPRDRSAFSTSASEILRQVQKAIGELLFESGLEESRSTEIGRELGLDKTLAWKISRFAREADPLKAARHMPGAGGMRIVLDAANAFGASDDRIESVRRAEADFRRFVEERAGDLRTFEAMLTGTQRDDKSELDKRRSHFQSGAAIWGVRASSQFLMLALCPSKYQEGMIDVVQTSGFDRLERLKPDTPWIVRRLLTTSDKGDRLTFDREPLDARGVTSPGSLPLMTEFCSDPLPEIRQFEGSDGVVYDEVMPSPLGPKGAVSVIMGEFYKAAVSAVRSEDNCYGRYKLTVRTPLKHVLLDVLIHKELTNFSPMTMTVEALLEGRPPAADFKKRIETAMLSAPAKCLGNPPVFRTPRLPQYESITRRALSLAGYSPKDFRGYRATTEYPAAPSEIVLTSEIL